jgi:hypothetical protein
MAPWESDVIILGLAERAQYVRDGNTNLQKWNVLGLKQVIIAPFYPYSLAGLHLAVAFRAGKLPSPQTLRVVDASDKEIGTISFSAERVAANEEIPTRLVGEPLILLPPDGWIVAFLPMSPTDPIVVMRPGSYRFLCATDGGEEHVVGRFEAVVTTPSALTPERVAAIRTDPNAVKAVRVSLQCRKCPPKLVVYAGLDRADTTRHSEARWYADLPEEEPCSCGATVFDLRTLRTNLHALLGRRLPGDGEGVGYERLYEESALLSVLSDFKLLLSQNAREEVLQQFIQEHPVLLHQFPAERLFFKPAILTFFKADFAVLTSQRELLLIEIERADTRLLRKNGDEASGLHHAVDQVQRWLQVIGEHRSAILDGLGLEAKSVSAVRGVVIAGRDKGYDAQHLRRAKGVDRGQVRFLTYDDIAFGLGALLRRIHEL